MVLLFLGLLVSVGLISAYLGYRYFVVPTYQLPPLIPVVEKTNPASLSVKTTKKIEPGISAPEKLPSGDTIVTIGSTLLFITTQGPNGVYAMEISVPYNERTYTFQVDLGLQNFTIGEEIVTIEENTKTAKPDDLIIMSNFQEKTVGEIYDEYKERKGQLIKIVVVTDVQNMNPKQRKNCNASCVSRLNFYKKYAFNNKLLESPEKINPDIPLNIGAVAQVVSSVYGF